MSPRPPPFSPVIFATLAVILAASMTTFLLLVRRLTTRRQWVGLGEWARQRRFRFEKGDRAALPADVVDLVRGDPPRYRLTLAGEATFAMQVETASERWHLLVRRAPARRGLAAAGLRAVGVNASFLDRLKLSSFPSLALGHRFTVLGATSAAARALADSASRTLLPADISLLVSGEWILLDFSTRPFDPIELERMLALAQQLGQML